MAQPQTLTNRQMAARFLKLGFRKSNIALSRNAHYWKYPGHSALFFYSKNENGGVAASCPDHPEFSFPLGLSTAKFEQFLEMGVAFRLNDNGEVHLRQALLDIAGHFVKCLETAEPDPDSIMGIMNNIKSLADEIKGGA